MTGIPSPALLGVERVVIACEPIAGLSAGERTALCSQLVKKAAALTDYPVSLASSADLDRSNLALRSRELILEVAGTAATPAAGRRTITLQVTPMRPARPMADHAAIASSVSMVKIQNDWMLQGRVPAFEQLLRGTRQPRLHTPITAD